LGQKPPYVCGHCLWLLTRIGFSAILGLVIVFMLHVLQIVEIILSILLITAILLQNQGSGLGGAFGGEGNVYRTKRGLEKRLFQATIGLAVLFFGMAIAAIFLS